jgi:hypothetical protein
MLPVWMQENKTTLLSLTVYTQILAEILFIFLGI